MILVLLNYLLYHLSCLISSTLYVLKNMMSSMTLLSFTRDEEDKDNPHVLGCLKTIST